MARSCGALVVSPDLQAYRRFAALPSWLKKGGCLMPVADAKLELIRRVPLFQGCGGKDLVELGRLADEVDVPANTVLIRQGTTADAFYIVVEGRLRVERDGRVVSQLGPGEFVGEIALVDGGPRTATVTTEAPSRLLVVGHREFHSLLDRFPSIERQVLLALAQRVRAAQPEAVH